MKEHLEKRLFVYLLALVQWLAYIALVLPFFDRPVIMTGSGIDGAAKVIGPFHFWIVSISALLTVSFFKTVSREENYMTVISALTTLFSSINLGLYFVDGFTLLMAFTRIATDGLYFALAATSTLKLVVQVANSFSNYLARAEDRQR